MSPWAAFLITLSLIIFVHELGHFLVARCVGVTVERFSLGFGPCLLRIGWGGTEYCICLFPFGGYVKMAGESMEEGPAKPGEYRSRSVGERASIVLAGPLINYLLGFALFVLIFIVGAPILSTKIGQVLAGYPAAEAGVKEGDKILTINGKPVDAWEDVTQTIHTQTTPITLSVERKGTSLVFRVQPMVKEVTNLIGVPVRVGLVGITPSEEVQTRRYPFPQAVIKAAEKIWSLTTLTLQALWRIATGGMPLRESITGPIGIFYLTSSVARQGAISLLSLIAVLSTSLGLFNLLPIPILDGGHLLFLFFERLKGKPVSLKIQETMIRIGLGLLTLLLVVVTYNDLLKFGIANKLLSLFGRG